MSSEQIKTSIAIVGTRYGDTHRIEGSAVQFNDDGALYIYGPEETIVAVYPAGEWTFFNRAASA